MRRYGTQRQGTSNWRALEPHQKNVLMCTLAVNALLFFDQTAVTVALPALQRAFHASSTGLQWTITAYLLALATLMVAAGRIADRFGRKRMLLAGLAVFGVASAACAAAPTLTFLIVARFVQGVGGAIMQPMALAHAGRVVGEEHRGWAVGLLSMGGTTFLTAGPLLSGAIIEVANWRWLFVVNLPVVLLAWYLGHRWIRPEQEPEPGRFDRLGLLLLVVGLGTCVIGISQLAHWRWVSPWLIGGGIVLLGLFTRRELRRPNPLIPIALLGHDRALLSSLVALFAIQFAVLGSSVYLVLFLQHGLGERALTAGLVLALSGVCTPLLSIRTGLLTDKYGSRTLVIGGLVLATAGLTWLGLTARRHELLLLLPGLLTFSLSRPAVFTPASAGAFVMIPAQLRGLASGLVTEARQLGGLLGVAVLGAVLAGVRGTDLTEAASLAEGFEVAMLVAAAVTAAAAVTVSATLLRRGT